jgi:methanogenic corrinoid protein MtbC1
MVGGVPVTAEWAKNIGADAYSEDALDCCAVAKKLIEE